MKRKRAWTKTTKIVSYQLYLIWPSLLFYLYADNINNKIDSSTAMCNDPEQFGSLGVPAPVCHHTLVIAVSCHPTAPTLIFRDHFFFWIRITITSTSVKPHIVTIFEPIHIIVTKVSSRFDRGDENILEKKELFQ